MSNNDCPIGASNKARLDGVEDGMVAMRRDFADLRKVIEAALKRPSWAVCLMITGLVSTCVGLLITIFRITGS